MNLNTDSVQRTLDELREKQREWFWQMLERGEEYNRVKEELKLSRRVFHEYLRKRHTDIDTVFNVEASMRLCKIIPKDYHLSDKECDYLMAYNNLQLYEGVYMYFLRDNEKEE